MKILRIDEMKDYKMMSIKQLESEFKNAAEKYDGDKIAGMNVKFYDDENQLILNGGSKSLYIMPKSGLVYIYDNKSVNNNAIASILTGVFVDKAKFEKFIKFTLSTLV